MYSTKNSHNNPHRTCIRVIMEIFNCRNISAKGSSTKNDHFMRVCMDKNEKNNKVQLRDHPQNTTTLWEFLWTKMKKMTNFN